jgi:hypothetical protein
VTTIETQQQVRQIGVCACGIQSPDARSALFCEAAPGPQPLLPGRGGGRARGGQPSPGQPAVCIYSGIYRGRAAPGLCIYHCSCSVEYATPSWTGVESALRQACSAVSWLVLPFTAIGSLSQVHCYCRGFSS